MSRTVYAISTGEYSDYRVDLLFTTRELALAYLGGREEESQEYIQEFTLYDEIPERQVLWSAFAFVSRTRRSYGPRIYSLVVPPDPVQPKCRTSQPHVYDEEIHFRAEGTDREAVMKSVSDRYHQALAEDDTWVINADWTSVSLVVRPASERAGERWQKYVSGDVPDRRRR